MGHYSLPLCLPNRSFEIGSTLEDFSVILSIKTYRKLCVAFRTDENKSGLPVPCKDHSDRAGDRQGCCLSWTQGWLLAHVLHGCLGCVQITMARSKCPVYYYPEIRESTLNQIYYQLSWNANTIHVCIEWIYCLINSDKLGISFCCHFPRKGAVCCLNSLAEYKAEQPHTSLLTGCNGFWFKPIYPGLVQINMKCCNFCATRLKLMKVITQTRGFLILFPWWLSPLNDASTSCSGKRP